MSGTRAITLSLDIRGAEQVKRALEQLGPTGEAALRRLDDAARRSAGRGGVGAIGTAAQEATRALEQMGGRLGPIGSGLSAIGVGGAAASAAVAGLGVGLAATARAGDQMVASLARLASATGSVEAASAAYDQLYRLSLQTGVSVSESAGAFQRFAIAAREVGGTNDQAMALVATLQRAAIVAGASGQEASAAAGQLAQALASGVLQGDELRSLLENMPSLAVALARELGVGVGELRRMGSEGQLTADRVLPALVRAGEQINEEFAKLPPTMERGFQQLGVATTKFLADLSNALGLSQAIAVALTGAANAVDGARGAIFRTPQQQAQDRVAAAERRVADVARREAESRASGRRGNPEAFQRQRDEALAELERAQIAALTIEREGDLARFNEAQRAAEQRLANERRQMEQGLEALRAAYGRRETIEATFTRASTAIQQQLAAGNIQQAEATRLLAAAERERADALRRLAGEAPPAAAGLRQVRAATPDRGADQDRRDWEAAEREHERGEERLRAAALRANEARERDAEQSAQNISRYLADGFTDAFLDGERGFAGMLDSIKRLAIATPIRIGVEAVVTPIAQSAISGITGAAGQGGGAGGFAELFGLAQAGRQLMNLPGMNSLGGVGGSVTGFLQTPLFSPLQGGETVTLGGAVGGIGAGFAIGNFTSGLTAGDSRARQQNGQIGAGIGAIAGAPFGPLGSMAGGAIGGAIGGMIGPGRAFSGGDALIGVNDNGGLNVVGYAGKNFEESAALLAQAQQEVAALNATLAAAGLRFATGQGGTDPGSFAAAIGGGESGNARDLLGALRQGGVGGLRAEDARVQGALDRLFTSGGGSIEQQIGAAQEAAAFAAQIDAIAQAAKDAEDPIGAIRRSYEEQFKLAERLGFGYETLAAQQQKAIDAAQKQLDAEKESTRQREESTQRARLSSATGLIDDLTFGGLSGSLSGEARATAARLRLAGARNALGDGATQEELDELRRVAGATLPVIQQVEGITESLAALQRGIANDLRAAVPGADAANLAGVIGATTSIGDQITTAVEAYGGAQVQEVRALREEVARLATLMAAQQARAA